MTIRRAFLSAVFILALPIGSVLAAPQMLGVIATNDAEPMRCEGTKCSVILGAFCLQRDRSPPAFGTAYTPIGGAGITVVVETGAGDTVRLPADGLLRFYNYAGYTSVRATLDRSRLAGLDPRAIAVEVGARVTMAAIQRDPELEPVDPAEIALAIGPLRAAGEAIFEQPGERNDAARLIASAINLVPEDDARPSSTGEPLQRLAARRSRLIDNAMNMWSEDDTDLPAPGALWQRLAARNAGLTPEGIARGRRMFQACRRESGESVGFGMRDCLQIRHKNLMREINKTYWDSLRGGV